MTQNCKHRSSRRGARRRFSTLLVVVVVVFGAPGARRAEARPNVAAMRCADASALVERRGAVVATTSRTTYDRFVRDQSFCMLGETTEPAYVATRDNAACVIGYVCGNATGGTP